jgi:DNA helicase-2/ATP-dependent DNA helicase PcrA
MAKRTTNKATLIIAGPGAGKTHNMVFEIIQNLPLLTSCRYMAVITHTNAATNNIKDRLGKKITLPPNLFIGTIHAFLNKFIIIPYSSFGDAEIPEEKLFVQFGIDEAVKGAQKKSGTKITDHKDKAKLKANIANALKKKGYITFDQTLSLSRDTMANQHIASQVANRLQFLFVDEFQDTGNEVGSIIEVLRKIGKTKIYCVGDPEQYIQSFDSSIQTFANIPILKAARSNTYEVTLNKNNFRCSQSIIDFLNFFNGRIFDNMKFEQQLQRKSEVEEIISPNDLEVCYIIGGDSNVSPIIEVFYKLCDDHQIAMVNRCLLAKQEHDVKRIIAAVNRKYKNPKKNGNLSPINIIRDTILVMLGLNSEQFYSRYDKTAHDLRKLSVELFHAIRIGQIKDENDFGIYLRDDHQLIVKHAMLVKIEDLKYSMSDEHETGVVTVANIHTIKGLEHEAVLAITKTEQELLNWIETDRIKRDADDEDICRIGYVAFSRAERLLCISCLSKITKETENLLRAMRVKIC